MIDLITEAQRFQSLCVQRGWQFCFIGGLPVQHWGEPRLTRDVDVIVLTHFGDEDQYVEAVLKSYQPRRPDAKEFALRNRVLLVRSDSGIGLDISLGALPFEEQMIKRAANVEFLPGVELRICSPEDLMVMKCFANRPQDWQDVSSVIVRQGEGNLDWNYIESNLEPLVALKEEPEIIEQLARLRRDLEADGLQ
jgi:Nucleotidyltransferase of unknown function (DUF6036)